MCVVFFYIFRVASFPGVDIFLSPLRVCIMCGTLLRPTPPPSPPPPCFFGEEKKKAIKIWIKNTHTERNNKKIRQKGEAHLTPRHPRRRSHLTCSMCSFRERNSPSSSYIVVICRYLGPRECEVDVRSNRCHSGVLTPPTHKIPSKPPPMHIHKHNFLLALCIFQSIAAFFSHPRAPHILKPFLFLTSHLIPPPPRTSPNLIYTHFLLRFFY